MLSCTTKNAFFLVPDSDPQKGENEPEPKKQKPDLTSTSGQASEPPTQKDKGKAPETSEVPINPTPLSKLQGDFDLPSDPKLAKFVLNVVSRHQETQPTKPTSPPKPTQPTTKPKPSTPTQAETTKAEPTKKEATSAETPEKQKSKEDTPTEPTKESKGKDSTSDPNKAFIQKAIEKQKHFIKPLNAEIIHASRYAAIDAKVFLMLPNFANEYDVTSEENDRFSAHRLAKEEAFTSIPINKVSEVKHVPFEKTKIIYSIYEVIREDKKKQYFCDNDLLSINPQDLIPLGRRMKQKMNERKNPQDEVAFYRIIRCIESFVRFMKQTDFETGIKFGETLLSICAPNENREGMEHLPAGTIITKPELGMAFRRPGRRCFFRLSEIKKYSSDVIEIIQSFASIQKDQGRPEDELRVAAEKIYQRCAGALKRRRLCEVFQKIITHAPDAPF